MTTASEYDPVVPLTATKSAATKTLLGLKMRSATSVPGPGAGETWPDMWMAEVPPYDCESVPTETVYVTAETGAAIIIATASAIIGRRSLFMAYTDTAATAAEETGTCWFVVASAVRV